MGKRDWGITGGCGRGASSGISEQCFKLHVFNKKKGRNEGGKVKRNKEREGVRKKEKGGEDKGRMEGKTEKEGERKRKSNGEGQNSIAVSSAGGDTGGLTGLGVWLKGSEQCVTLGHHLGI